MTVAWPLPPIVLAPLEIGPGCPTIPIIWDRDIASLAAASTALYMSEFTNGFVLERADFKIGCASRCEEVMLSISVCAAPFAEARFGEPETVVAPVPAVGGLSSEALDMAAPDVLGNFPVNSNRWMRDFNSSSSSQTVEGAAVEFDDSDAS